MARLKKTMHYTDSFKNDHSHKQHATRKHKPHIIRTSKKDK